MLCCLYCFRFYGAKIVIIGFFCRPKSVFFCHFGSLWVFLISQKKKNSVNLFEKCGPKMFFFRLLGHHFAKILLFGANKTASRFHALHASRFCKWHLASANGISLPRTPAPQVSNSALVSKFCYFPAFTLSTYFLIPSTPSVYMSTNFVAKGGIFPGCIPSASCITST